MTNVMLADYPDVFKAGAAFMGVPDHCFFTGTVDGWNSACAQGQVSMTAQAWGDLARGADPGYSGARGITGPDCKQTAGYFVSVDRSASDGGIIRAAL